MPEAMDARRPWSERWRGGGVVGEIAVPRLRLLQGKGGKGTTAVEEVCEGVWLKAARSV